MDSRRNGNFYIILILNHNQTKTIMVKMSKRIYEDSIFMLQLRFEEPSRSLIHGLGLFRIDGSSDVEDILKWMVKSNDSWNLAFIYKQEIKEYH